jgi:hypothetical protein
VEQRLAGRWLETTPMDLRFWLEPVAVPWWVAGGWALDLWLGKQTRPHSDIEFGCWRADLPLVVEALAGWDIAVARNKIPSPFDRAQLPEPPFSLWIRRPGDELWAFELLTEERRGEAWVYRRDERLSLPAEKLTIETDTGWRVITPEVQLLYKSKALRTKDRQDFDAVAPHLNAAQCSWLRDALFAGDPGHAWVVDLAERMQERG